MNTIQGRKNLKDRKKENLAAQKSNPKKIFKVKKMVQKTKNLQESQEILEKIPKLKTIGGKKILKLQKWLKKSKNTATKNC